VFIYSTVPLVAVYGLREEGVRMTAVVYGVLTVASSFLFARLLLGSGQALIAAFVVAVSPWHIHFSRIGFELISFPFFLILGLALFLIAVRPPSEEGADPKSRRWLLPLAALTLAISLYTYRAAWIVVPLVLLLIAVLYRKDLRGRPFLLPSLLILMIAVVPIVVHLLSGHDRAYEVSMSTLGLGVREALLTFIDFYFRHFDPNFLFYRAEPGPSARDNLPDYGLLYPWFAPLILIGLAALALRRRREDLLILGLLLIYPVVNAVTNYSPITGRPLFASIVFALLSAAGFQTLLDWTGHLRRPIQRYALPSLVSVLALAGTLHLASYLERYHREYPLLGADYHGWQYGPRQIIGRFVQEAREFQALVLDWHELDGPEIFFKFYAGTACTECRVSRSDSWKPQLSRREMFAVRPQYLNTAFPYRTIDSIPYPNGRTAFQLVEVNDGAFAVEPAGVEFGSLAPEATLGDELRLSAVALVPRLARVILQWEVLRVPLDVYRVSVRAIDETGEAWAQSDLLLGGPDESLTAASRLGRRYTLHHLPLPLVAPAQEYRLQVIGYLLGPLVPEVTDAEVVLPAIEWDLGPLPDWAIAEGRGSLLRPP
jgi:hypothetical protein